MRLAILGRTKMLYNAAELLAGAGHRIVLVGTCREQPEYGCTAEDFQSLAARHGAAFFNDYRINSPEILARLKQSGAELAVSVNWLTVIGREAIESFPMGILNAHGGDLPRYRGNACFNWAILNGEDHAGLCVHFMKAGELDSGDILLKRLSPISEKTAIGELNAWAHQQIPEMFLEAVGGLENGALTAEPQTDDPALALRGYPRRPEDGLIDWKMAATRIDRLVRASSEPFTGAYTFYKGQKFIVWKASLQNPPTAYLAVPGQVLARNRDSGFVRVAAGDGALALEITQLEGCPQSRPYEIVTSIRDRLGLNVEEEIMKLRQALQKKV